MSAQGYVAAKALLSLGFNCNVVRATLLMRLSGVVATGKAAALLLSSPAIGTAFTHWYPFTHGLLQCGILRYAGVHLCLFELLNHSVT